MDPTEWARLGVPCRSPPDGSLPRGSSSRSALLEEGLQGRGPASPCPDFIGPSKEFMHIPELTFRGLSHPKIHRQQLKRPQEHLRGTANKAVNRVYSHWSVSPLPPSTP